MHPGVIILIRTPDPDAFDAVVDRLDDLGITASIVEYPTAEAAIASLDAVTIHFPEQSNQKPAQKTEEL